MADGEPAVESVAGGVGSTMPPASSWREDFFRQLRLRRSAGMMMNFTRVGCEGTDERKGIESWFV